MDAGDVWKLVLFTVAMLGSAFFSGSEAAYLSIQRSKLAALSRLDPKKAARIDRLAGNPEKLLSTVLTGNNLANTSAAALATGLFLSYLSPNAAVLASTVGVTILLLVFTEAIPKIIATRYSVGTANAVAFPLRVAEVVLFPAAWSIEQFVRALGNALRLPKGTTISREEIVAMVGIGQESGTVDEAQAQVIDQLFRVDNIDLQEIMTHRTRVVGLEKGANLDEFFETYQATPHSRMPVYEESLDNIVGVIVLRDVVTALASGRIESDSDVTTLARPAHFFPENLALGDIFRQIEETGHGIVFLVDEFGGTTGLVTSKQMVQTVVGQIGAETDDLNVKVDTQGISNIDGGLLIEEIAVQFGLQIPEGDYDTVAGFILSELGTVPKAGQRLEYRGFALEVVEMDDLRIGRVRITKLHGRGTTDIN